jgi:centrosomal protein CEP104
VINRILKELTPILLLKIEELNYRARDISLHTLLSVFRHPAAKIGILVNKIYSVLFKDNSFNILYRYNLV